MLLAGVLMPPVILAVPQYLLLAKVDLTDSYLSVLLPSILSPYGVYLARIYAAAAVPDAWWRPAGSTARASGGSSAGSRCR